MMTLPVRRGWSLLAGAILALCGGTAAGHADGTAAPDLPPPAKIRDLDYGDALFRFFQDDYFDALVRLEVSKELGRLPTHAAEAELLAGGLYLSLGMHTEATRRFERLLAGPVPQSVSDRAHFYLARIGYQRGYLEEAWMSLGRIRGPLPANLEPERRLLAANVLMAQGRFQEAATALDGWVNAGDWADYARFNLGVALVRSGDPVRGRQLLATVGAMPARSEEQLALRDRANLALGFALLQERQPDAAVVALSQVRLDGPFTNRALLGLGWAETDALRPDRALVPWLELRARPVLDAAVQESLLAVPFAYAKLAANGQAADQYRHAVSAYSAEARRLEESIAAIRGGGFLEAVIDAAPAAQGAARGVDWLWQLQRAPDAPHTRYLYQLLASHEFQEGLRNYRDLRIMRSNLERWVGSLQAFDELVEAREVAASVREPRKVERLAAVDAEVLRQRRDVLNERVTQVVATRDVVALASPEEATQWRQLAEVDARIDALPPGELRDAMAERTRVLQGTLAWQLDAAYKLRLSRLRSAQRQVDDALAELQRRYASVEQAGDLAPRSTAGFASRVRELEQRTARLLPRLEATAGAQERLLAGIAVRELEAQQARLASYATQARFALAALYDGAATGGSQ
jgi:predicted negative regulator of RcsB-dependent stress response